MSIKKDPEVFYYNIEILNPNSLNNDIHSPSTSGLFPAQIRAENNIPILDNPSNYYMTLLSSSIPLRNCPLFQILIQTPIASVSDINTTIYSITLQYQQANGTVIASSPQTYLVYAPRNFYQIPNYTYPAPVQIYSPYYYCFQVHQILDMINDAFKSALQLLQAQPGTTPIGAATQPYITYDPTTQLLTVTAEQSFYDMSAGTPYIAIYCNLLCEPFFSGFEKISSTVAYTTPNGADRQLIVKSYNGTNVSTGPPAMISVIQPFTNYGYWSFVKKILVTTNMNINSEVFFINKTKQSQQNAITYGGQIYQNQNYVSVLYSFEPDFSQLAGELGSGSKIQIYNAPTNLYHPTIFNQITPLYSFDLAVYVEDKFGTSFLLPLGLNSGCDFKFQFIRKDLVKF